MGYREVVLADSPVWYSRVGESSGTTATDEVSGFNGTYVNTPTLGVTGALVGDSDTAVTLAAASTEHITIPDDARFDFGTGDWSLELWVKQAANGQTSDWLFSKGGQFSLFLNSSGRLKTDNFTGSWSVTSNAAVNGDTAWHHLVATRSGSTFALYRDGAAIAATESGTVNLAANAVDVFIGVESSGSNPFNGTIDEPAIYGTALSAARVLAHYQAGITEHHEGTFADGAVVADTATAHKTGQGAVTDAAVATDAATGTKAGAGAVADAPVAADAFTGAKATTGSVADAVVIAESWTGRKVARGTFADTTTLTEAAAGTKTGQGSVADGAVVTDSWSAAGSVAGSFADAVAVSEAWTGRKVVRAVLSDSVALGEAATGAKGAQGSVSEGLSLADAWTAHKVATGVLADGMVVGEAWSAEPPFDWEHATGTVTLEPRAVGIVTVTRDTGVVTTDDGIPGVAA